MWASEKGEREIIELLIQNGADINLEDNYGNTALSIALRFGHNEIAGYLRQVDESQSNKIGSKLKNSFRRLGISIQSFFQRFRSQEN